MSANHIVGQVYGRLRVLERAGVSQHGAARWLCQCSCGSIAYATSSALTGGRTRSCGCLASDVRAARTRRTFHSGLWVDLREMEEVA